MTPPIRRLLVNAYAAYPGEGSESGVGWEIGRRLGRHFAEVVILHGTQRHLPVTAADAIATACVQGGCPPQVRWVAVDEPRLYDWARRCSGSGFHGFYYAGYRLWQRRALQVAQELHAQQPFDAVHQLNMIGFREPGFLWRMGIPFSWGPIGGASDIPWSFILRYGWHDRLHYGMRNLLNRRDRAWGGRARAAARCAGRVLCVGADELALVRSWSADGTHCPEVGLTPTVTRHAASPPRDRGALRLGWCAMQIGRKGLDLALRTCAALPATIPWDLDVLGEAVQGDRYRCLAQTLGIAQHVHWHCHLSRGDAQQLMAGWDAFVFPTQQEGTSSVLLEAIAAGVPVITHDICGAALVLAGSEGLVPLIAPAESVRRMSTLLQRIWDEPGLWERIRAHQERLLPDLGWDEVARRIAEHIVAPRPVASP